MNASRARTILLLLLAASFALLATVALWRPGLEKSPQGVLLRLDPDSIQRLAVAGPKASAVAYVRDGASWVIAEPALLAPNPRQLKDVLAVATATSRASYSVTELGLQATGLEEPAVTLSVDDRSFEFGNRAPVSGDRYVRVGEQIHLLDDIHYHTLTLPLDAYLAPKLLAERERLRAIRLPSHSLRRGAGSHWEIEGEVGAGVRAADVARIWETAVAAAVQPYSHTASASGRVELVAASSDQPVVFEILALPGKPDFILGRADLGIQYHFPPETGRHLLGLGAAR